MAASAKSGQEMPAGLLTAGRVAGEALRRARGSYAPFYAPQQLFHVKGVALDKRHLCEGFQQGFSGCPSYICPVNSPGSIWMSSCRAETRKPAALASVSGLQDRRKISRSMEPPTKVWRISQHLLKSAASTADIRSPFISPLLRRIERCHKRGHFDGRILPWGRRNPVLPDYGLPDTGLYFWGIEANYSGKFRDQFFGGRLQRPEMRTRKMAKNILEVIDGISNDGVLHTFAKS